MKRLFLVLLTLAAVSGCGAPAIRETDDTILIPVHNRKWQIALERHDWSSSLTRVHNNGTSHIYHLADDKTKVSLTIFVNKAAPCKSAPECRQHWIQNTMSRTGRPYAVEHFDDGRFLTTRYMILRGHGITINQLNYASHAYLDGIWVYMVVSKIQAANDDAKFMSAVARSVRFVDLKEQPAENLSTEIVDK